jgi:DNA-binding PadR family transcriptional regulator
MAQLHMSETELLDRELKKGSTELLVLSLVEERARHGYEIGRLIEKRCVTAGGGSSGSWLRSLFPPSS